MSNQPKPAHIKLRAGSFKDTAFETPGQRDAARAIIRHWSETHNFSEIARRTGWSASHVRETFEEYFEAAEDADEGVTIEDVEEASVTPEDLQEAWQDGYREGYRDGFKDGQEN